MPFDVEVTPVYPGLDAVYTLGGCVGVIVPSVRPGGVVFFHFESATMCMGDNAEEAIGRFYHGRKSE